MTATQRDLDQAWGIIEMCARVYSGDSFRAHLAEQIALLLAELRKAKRNAK